MAPGDSFKPEHRILCHRKSTRNPYPDFNWWNEAPKKKAKFLRRDELPIPRLPDRYPYRYTSAGPCSVGRTAKEMDIFRMSSKLQPKEVIEDKLNFKMINQVRGYETTSMTASLEPFRKVGDYHVSSRIPGALNESLYVPYQSHSKFERYIVDLLHPGWKNDPLYKRCIKFSFQESPEDSGPTEVSRR